MRTTPFLSALAAAVGAASVFATSAAMAQVLTPGVVVYDPSNYAQNVMTAARALQQVDNSLRSLQNQAAMLVNQARNLANLPYSSLTQLQSSITQTQQQLSSAQRISYNVTAINQAFTQNYPQSYAIGSSSQQLISDAETRWKNALVAFQDALKVQAGVVQNLNTTHTQISALVSSSQSASGALQAAQSGNQLLALQTTQLSDLTAVMAAIARAQSLDAARSLETSAQAQAQVAIFLNYGSGYQAGSAAMFH